MKFEKPGPYNFAKRIGESRGYDGRNSSIEEEIVILRGYQRKIEEDLIEVNVRLTALERYHHKYCQEYLKKYKERKKEEREI